MNVVNMWVDNSVVGCGERVFIVAKVGTKFVHLFDPNQMRGIQVDRADFERYAKPANVNPRKVRLFLKRQARDWRQFNHQYSAKAVKAAEAVLEG